MFSVLNFLKDKYDYEVNFLKDKYDYEICDLYPVTRIQAAMAVAFMTLFILAEVSPVTLQNLF
jgi:hypothetical protein